MELKSKFYSIEELNAWFDFCCTRCAMCNRDCGKADPCEKCKANKIYNDRKDEIETRNK